MKETPEEICEAEKARRNAILNGDDKELKKAELNILCNLMKAQYGMAELDEIKGVITLEVVYYD